MAIAGLRNASVLDSSFPRESQSLMSRRWANAANQDTPITQASSLLQMWQEIEGEHMVNPRQSGFRDQQRSDELNGVLDGTYMSERQESYSENGSEDAIETDNQRGTWSQGQMDSRSENADSNCSISEQFTDFGEVERERVRQIFQEWRKSGVRGQGSNVSRMKNCSREQWLGENERERVRIIREWVQKTSQHRGGASDGCREEEGAESGAQIEQVRDGLIVDHCEVGGRRAIRRLCGRQALLDLLVRAEIERQRELQLLLEHRPVSDFPHRNRIQSLLKGRFLRNERVSRDERPTSSAANELGLLRQRHTVSDLREGFLSRLDSFGHGSASSTHSDTSSNHEMNTSRDDENQITGSQRDNEPSDRSNGERGISGLRDDSHWREATAHVEEWQEEVMENEEIVEQLSETFEFNENRCLMAEDVGGSLQVSNADGWSQETSRNESEEQGHQLETSRNESEEQGHQLEALEVIQELYEISSNQSDAQGLSDVTDNYEGNPVENINLQDTSAQLDDGQESFIDNDETGWPILENVEVGGDSMDGNWHGASANQWYQTSENESEEPDEAWEENGVQEDMDNWLERPSTTGAAPVGRVTSLYFPESENEYSDELRELFSRRSVSSLLQSGFRESLDQLIRSYVQRQGNASSNWEDDEALPSPVLEEQDLEQQSGDQNEDGSDRVEGTSLFDPPALVSSSQPLWDQELHDANWPRHNLRHRSGTEWEILNDLRIDMAQLHQRMNNMQRILETCMDMQLELQRAVRQEVSAALNRSAGSTDEVVESMSIDVSKWDHVRRGKCCICSDSNIDSLLYRCGHMCTCSNCADKLVQSSGKCPMCRAPVIEMIRAYSIH